MSPSEKQVVFDWPSGTPKDRRAREDWIESALRRLATGTPFAGRALSVVIGLSERGWHCERVFAPDRDEDCPAKWGHTVDARLT